MLLAQKLKNQVNTLCGNKPGYTLIFKLKNIRINEQKRGCSGFVRRLETGGVVYINTEHSCYEPISDRSMYRYARDERDYSSDDLVNGDNRFCKDERLAENIIQMLTNGVGILRAQNKGE